MNVRVRALALVGALAGCAPVPVRPAERPWLELQGEHVSLRTDLGEAEARAWIADLETVRLALRAVLRGSSAAAPGPVEAVLLADAVELREFAAAGVAGYAVDGPGGRLLVFSAEQSPTRQPVLKHELAHVEAAELGVRGPRWLSEGLAVWLETLRLDEERGRAVAGEPDPARLAWLREHPVHDWAEVLAATEVAARDRGFSFECASFLLVHWLADRRPAVLEELLGRLTGGEQPEDAAAAALAGLGEGELGRQLRLYADQGRFGTREAPFRRWSGPVAARPLQRAEVLQTTARLHALAVGFADPGPQQERARAALDQARLLEPAPAAPAPAPAAPASPAPSAEPPSPAAATPAEGAFRLAQLNRPPVRAGCRTDGPRAPAIAVKPGPVRVRYLVSEDGRLAEIRALQGPAPLAAAVRAFLEGCSFEPGRRGGHPVAAEVSEVFDFGPAR